MLNFVQTWKKAAKIVFRSRSLEASRDLCSFQFFLFQYFEYSHSYGKLFFKKISRRETDRRTLRWAGKWPRSALRPSSICYSVRPEPPKTTENSAWKLLAIIHFHRKAPQGQRASLKNESCTWTIWASLTPRRLQNGGMTLHSTIMATCSGRPLIVTFDTAHAASFCVWKSPCCKKERETFLNFFQNFRFHVWYYQ